MKAIALMVMLFLATPVFAAELTEGDVKAFLSEWLEVQNSGSFSRYAEMYSETFTGIRRSGKDSRKFDRDSWLKDRKKMFEKKMVVKAVNPDVRLSGNTASIKFEQTWQSGTYSDKGYKIMVIASYGQKLCVLSEELLSSNKSTIAGYKSIYTTLQDKKCKPLSSKLSARFDNRRLERRECPAPHGWRVFTVIGGERFWMEIANGSSVWSMEDDVITNGEHRFGHFQSVDFDKLEWRVSNSGQVKATVVPVFAQDPEDYAKSLHRFFVIDLSGDAPTLCGVAMTRQAARDIADKAVNCKSKLPMKSVPGLSSK